MIKTKFKIKKKELIPKIQRIVSYFGYNFLYHLQMNSDKIMFKIK